MKDKHVRRVNRVVEQRKRRHVRRTAILKHEFVQAGRDGGVVVQQNVVQKPAGTLERVVHVAPDLVSVEEEDVVRAFFGRAGLNDAVYINRRTWQPPKSETMRGAALAGCAGGCDGGSVE